MGVLDDDVAIMVTPHTRDLGSMATSQLVLVVVLVGLFSGLEGNMLLDLMGPLSDFVRIRH